MTNLSDIIPPSNVVTDSSTDTLTNKTLTSPKINEDVAVTSTATEINILDGVTSTTAELNILDGVTSTTAELNILDGVTSTTAELNILDGVTSTAAELNILDGVTSTTAELNILDGVTSTASELNILDGVTATATEINKLDAVSRGSLIYGNASAETAILTKGSANQVLTSDGTDIAWADAGGGGAWTLLSSTTASASSQIDFTNIDSTYDDYMIVINNYYASSSSYLKARLKIDGSFRTDSNYWTVAAKFGKYNFEAPSAGGTSDFWKSNRYSDSIRFLSESSNMYENSSAPQKFILYLQDVNRAGIYKTIWGNMLVYDGSGTKHYYVPVHGAYAESAGSSNTNLAACTGIRFYPSTGTITAAVFKIYGLAKS